MRKFEPNAVYIPEEGADPDECTLLYMYGDSSYANLYTLERWKSKGGPNYNLWDGYYYSLTKDGAPKSRLCRAGLSIGDQEPVDYPHIQLLPDMHVVKIDETEYWDEEFRKKYQVTKIWGVYIFNRMKHVHLCSITPSYELIRMSSQWEDELDHDSPDYDYVVSALFDEVQDSDLSGERYFYYDVSQIDRYLKECPLKPFGGYFPTGKGGGYKIEVESVTEMDAITEIEELEYMYNL